LETKEWTWIDKSEWGDGPWQSEIDKRQWTDPATGLPCIIRRASLSGAWCGYVGVAPGHPLHGVAYQHADISVHGGLTYSDPCQPEAEHGICHIPGPGEPDDVWWFGFDFSHAFDLSPATHARIREIAPGISFLSAGRADDAYRTHADAVAEVTALAAQLKALETA
jgi:hypothetical protein